MKIDPRHLINLLAVANHGSFNRAAAARGLSQPALSNSIAQLERRLGFPVLTRSRRGSEVNEDGRLLLQGARTIEALLTQTAEQVRLKRLGVAGPLRIGATPSMTLKFMPDLMVRLLQDDAAVQIAVTEGLDDHLLPALQSGALDLVLSPALGSALPHDLVEEALFDDSFGIGVGPKHPLAKRRSLTLAELSDYPWVLPGPGSAYRRHVDALFLTAGVSWPQNSIVSNSLPLVESIVTRTNRVTVVTRLQATMHNFWRVRAIPLRSGGRRTLSILWRRAGQLSEQAVRVVHLAHELAAAYREAERRTVVARAEQHIRQDRHRLRS
jgi:LysR family transcriptional regulator, regulator for genes of the gallate degradation pathway